MIVDISFTAEVPEGIDVEDLTIADLARLIPAAEVRPLQDLPTVEVVK